MTPSFPLLSQIMFKDILFYFNSKIQLISKLSRYRECIFFKLIIFPFVFYFSSIIIKNDIIFPKLLMLKSGCITERVQDSNISIQNCLVKNLANNQGGSIYVNSGNYYLYVNDTTFYRCGAVDSLFHDGQGGAIFFYGIDIKLFRVCSYNCWTGPNGKYPFAYLCSDHDKYSDFLTITLSTAHSSTIRIYGGAQYIYNSNISNNYVWYYSAIFTTQCNISLYYCSIYNNTAQYSICIIFQTLLSTISISNIIRNNSPKDNAILNINYARSSVLNSCIFYLNENILFLVYASDSLTLYDCVISHFSSNISTNIGISPIFSPFMIANTNSFQLTHYQTQFIYSNQEIICLAQHQLPYLTPHITNTFFPSLNPTYSFFPTLSNSLFATFLSSPNPTLHKSLEQTIIFTAFQTPILTLVETNTIFQTNSFFPTKSVTIFPTMSFTSDFTPIFSHYPTPLESIFPTLCYTLNPTLINSRIPTISISLNPTLINSRIPTISISLNPSSTLFYSLFTSISQETYIIPNNIEFLFFSLDKNIFLLFLGFFFGLFIIISIWALFSSNNINSSFFEESEEIHFYQKDLWVTQL